MTWIPTFLRSRTDVDYTGYDLIPINIKAAKEKFKNESWKFQTFDLVKDKIGSFFIVFIEHFLLIPSRSKVRFNHQPPYSDTPWVTGQHTGTKYLKKMN